MILPLLSLSGELEKKVKVDSYDKCIMLTITYNTSIPVTVTQPVDIFMTTTASHDLMLRHDNLKAYVTTKQSDV